MKDWFKRLLSEQNGEPSSRRLLFFTVVMVTLGYLGYHIYKHGLDAFWADVTKMLVLTTGGAATAGRFAENKPSE